MIIFWHQRDLRIEGNYALSEAIKDSGEVLPIVFIEREGSAASWYWSESVKALAEEYKKRGSHLVLLKGEVKEEIAKLVKRFKANAVYYNRIYSQAESQVEKLSLEVQGFDGSYLVDPNEVLTKGGTPYGVFTPFSKAAKAKLLLEPLSFTIGKFSSPACSSNAIPKSKKAYSDYWRPGRAGALETLKDFKKVGNYAAVRDLPGVLGTSYLSPALHFGELSPAEVYQNCTNPTYRLELIWREFGNYLLYYNRHLDKHNYNEKFDNFPWQKSASLLKKWELGQTGYPLVDAGMRQLDETGWMHNRVRMVVASFLVKDLMIHWKDGAKVFMDKLVDADLASNSMNWQWCAGSGPDAAPFFRIFNPTLQGKKFDPKGDYVREFLPELCEVPTKFIHTPHLSGMPLDYPEPIVDHDKARIEALAAYKSL